MGAMGDERLEAMGANSQGFVPKPKVKGPSVFEQAGALQSTAATAGAEAEVGGINNAIQQLMALLSGGNAGLQQGATPQGFGDRLNQIINGDQFAGLVDERQRGLQGQLAAGGLTRSGTAMNAAAALPTELALGIEDQLYGRESQAFSNEANISQLIAQLLGKSGFATAEGIRGSAEAEAGGLLGEKGFQLQRQQAKDQNKNDFLSTVVGAGIMKFSDPRLKENVRLEGKIGPLDLVRWDWIPEVPDIVKKCKTIGFMSTQVKEFFPQYVSEYGGYDVINYTGLMGELDG